MPVYTVHAPITSSADMAPADRFAFVRDGFHFWAALFGIVWLAWHRLWLALLGWIVLMAAIDVGMVKLGADGGTITLVDLVLALLLGFEAASLERWTLSRRKWRQLDIVVADNEGWAFPVQTGPAVCDALPVPPDRTIQLKDTLVANTKHPCSPVLYIYTWDNSNRR